MFNFAFVVFPADPRFLFQGSCEKAGSDVGDITSISGSIVIHHQVGRPVLFRLHMALYTCCHLGKHSALLVMVNNIPRFLTL